MNIIKKIKDYLGFDKNESIVNIGDVVFARLNYDDKTEGRPYLIIDKSSVDSKLYCFPIVESYEEKKCGYMPAPTSNTALLKKQFILFKKVSINDKNIMFNMGKLNNNDFNNVIKKYETYNMNKKDHKKQNSSINYDTNYYYENTFSKNRIINTKPKHVYPKEKRPKQSNRYYHKTSYDKNIKNMPYISTIKKSSSDGLNIIYTFADTVIYKRGKHISSYIVLCDLGCQVILLAHNFNYLCNYLIVNKVNLDKLGHLSENDYLNFMLLLQNNIEDDNIVKYVPDDVLQKLNIKKRNR